MLAGRSLGRDYDWLWTAFAVSTFGTWIAFDALPLLAILVLHARPEAVSALAAVGLLAGAAVALPLGPWIEFRRKRPVMIAMDLIRFAATISIPITFALGWLSLGQLLIVSIIMAAADIAFRSASGACLKTLVKPDDLVTANGRLEGTMWTAAAIGPALGGVAIGMFGPVTTVIANAISFLLSALAIRRIGGGEPAPARRHAKAFRAAELTEGWRSILAHPVLRLLFVNTVLVNGLIMATAPLLAVLMLRDLGFAPWQYGLAFGAPCIGGLIGARLAPSLAARCGQHNVLLAAGTLRACWSLGLALMPHGATGIAVVFALQFGLVTCAGIFNPVFAAYRLAQIEMERTARVLSAWTITSSATIAVLTALWGVLAGIVGVRAAVALSGLLLLTTPLLLPRRALRVWQGTNSPRTEIPR
ncbi:MFS transporter [Bradyrhizobium sp. CCBAU 53421]|uniref:MFS transporter n=1 Tax=Bradyrhizobium sp. CCBAU 53421 TaxID=1325120 RepID=UPI00188CE108|nr:MFS transporter [Bradyrhizobium sp. CCBAU 53421]QOZ37297.1 MFS transporter [Bradyrhizobium sp. CCBAU 53421]